MESLIIKVADVILNLPEESLEDKDSLIATSVVKGIDCFSKVNKILLASRNKPLTEAKQEDVGRELSRILFYTASLSHLLELASDGFDIDSIKEFSENFEEVYKQDAILCSIHGIGDLIEISNLLYVDSDLEHSIGESENFSGVEIITGSDDAKLSPSARAAIAQVVKEAGIEMGEEDELEEEESCIASLFSVCFLLSQRLNLDFEALVYNSKLQEKL